MAQRRTQNSEIVKNIGFTSFPCTGRQKWTGGVRASDLDAPSLNGLVAHALDLPQIQNPESKIQNSPIQNPKSKLFFRISGILDLGFWILDRYIAILYVRPPTPQILDFGGGFWILERYVAVLYVQILDFGFWI